MLGLVKRYHILFYQQPGFSSVKCLIFRYVTDSDSLELYIYTLFEMLKKENRVILLHYGIEV